MKENERGKFKHKENLNCKKQYKRCWGRLAQMGECPAINPAIQG